MIALIAPDSYLYKTPDGKYWCKTIYSYDFFERYLAVFDQIVVASRTKYVEYSEVNGFLRSDGPNMMVRELPDMRGLSDYLKKYLPFCLSAKKAIDGIDCAIIRLPSIPAMMVERFVKKKKIPYAIEVVVDPTDAYGKSKMISSFIKRKLKRSCLSANGASYVTEKYLQRIYPSYAQIHGQDNLHFESYYSTIRLDQSFFGEPKKYGDKQKYRIIHTANNMNNDVKGHEVLIHAFDKVVKDGYNVELVFVGDGLLKSHFERLVKELKLDSIVRFTGMLSGAERVREELIKSDFLVFPTKAEGLPRTIIEAMAVGLPCISTPIAGIPELLNDEDLIDPIDVNGFVSRIEQFCDNPRMLERKSLENIYKAEEYSESVLSKRRNEYYFKLKDVVLTIKEKKNDR